MIRRLRHRAGAVQVRRRTRRARPTIQDRLVRGLEKRRARTQPIVGPSAIDEDAIDREMTCRGMETEPQLAEEPPTRRLALVAAIEQLPRRYERTWDDLTIL